MINLYSLFCHLLNIPPSGSNEGSVEEVAHILSSQSRNAAANHDTKDVLTDPSVTLSDHSTESGKFFVVCRLRCQFETN